MTQNYGGPPTPYEQLGRDQWDRCVGDMARYVYDRRIRQTESDRKAEVDKFKNEQEFLSAVTSSPNAWFLKTSYQERLDKNEISAERLEILNRHARSLKCKPKKNPTTAIFEAMLSIMPYCNITESKLENILTLLVYETQKCDMYAMHQSLKEVQDYKTDLKVSTLQRLNKELKDNSVAFTRQSTVENLPTILTMPEIMPAIDLKYAVRFGDAYQMFGNLDHGKREELYLNKYPAVEDKEMDEFQKYCQFYDDLKKPAPS